MMFAEIFGISSWVFWVVLVSGIFVVLVMLAFIPNPDHPASCSKIRGTFPSSDTASDDSADSPPDDDFDQGYNQDRSQNGRF